MSKLVWSNKGQRKDVDGLGPLPQKQHGSNRGNPTTSVPLVLRLPRLPDVGRGPRKKEQAPGKGALYSSTKQLEDRTGSRISGNYWTQRRWLLKLCSCGGSTRGLRALFFLAAGVLLSICLATLFVAQRRPFSSMLRPLLHIHPSFLKGTLPRGESTCYLRTR